MRALAVGGPAVLGTAAWAGPSAAATDTTTFPKHGTSHRGLEVILLGTQAGPPPAVDRAGISSALIVDGTTYLVDCGRSAVTQYQRAGLAYASLKNIFLTHLHADHIADYYNFLMLAGLPSASAPGDDMVPAPVTVHGPGSAGALPDPFGGKPVDTVHPSDPVPGTAALTEACHAAFAYSTNVFMRDNGMRDIRSLVDVREIDVPDVGASARGKTAPPMRRFTVMEDDRVKVTAVLVPHGPVFPSFAFRFDTDHGSVSFSGDTKYSENVIRLARSCDLLVHEALGDPSAAGLGPEVEKHMLESHTLVDDVGSLAAKRC